MSVQTANASFPILYWRGIIRLNVLGKTFVLHLVMRLKGPVKEKIKGNLGLKISCTELTKAHVYILVEK